MATVLSCNACNKQFGDDSEQKLHYRSEWHRYNLKRKVAGVPGVTEPLFIARQSAQAEENKANETPMLYSCRICGKGYRSVKAHAQHLKSRTHVMRASQGPSSQNEENTVIKPLQQRAPNNLPSKHEDSDEDESGDDEWVEVDEDDIVDETTKSLNNMNVGDGDDDESNDEEDDEILGELDPSCCFMCDQDLENIESCMVHMHKYHGFFIPDVEYLKDAEGLLTYLALKVKRDLMCLYCNDRCHSFNSLEAVRKHMVAKSHCKVHYGDGSDEEEAELEDFYDYSSSFVDADGKQMVISDDMDNSVSFGTSGSELMITTKTEKGKSTKTFGSREFLRYYRQKPRPSDDNNVAYTAAALASRYRSMGLATLQSREQKIRMKMMKKMNNVGVEHMRSKMGMKSNVIRNLPSNVPY